MSERGEKTLSKNARRRHSFLWVCEECGGDDIKCLGMVDPNTGEGSTDESKAFCGECGVRTMVEVKRTDFERCKAGKIRWDSEGGTYAPLPRTS